MKWYCWGIFVCVWSFWPTNLEVQKMTNIRYVHHNAPEPSPICCWVTEGQLCSLRILHSHATKFTYFNPQTFCPIFLADDWQPFGWWTRTFPKYAGNIEVLRPPSIRKSQSFWELSNSKTLSEAWESIFIFWSFGELHPPQLKTFQMWNIYNFFGLSIKMCPFHPT